MGCNLANEPSTGDLLTSHRVAFLADSVGENAGTKRPSVWVEWSVTGTEPPQPRMPGTHGHDANTQLCFTPQGGLAPKKVPNNAFCCASSCLNKAHWCQESAKFLSFLLILDDFYRLKFLDTLELLLLLSDSWKRSRTTNSWNIDAVERKWAHHCLIRSA